MNFRRTQRQSLSMTLRQVEPARVEEIMRAASVASGSLEWQEQLWTLMEDTWERLSGAVLDVKSAIRATQWEVRPHSSGSPEAIRRADALRSMVQMWRPNPATAEVGWEGFLQDCFDGVTRGVSVQEIRWQRTREGLACPRAALYLPGRYMGWDAQAEDLRFAWDGFGPYRETWDVVRDQVVISSFRIGSRSSLAGSMGLLRPLAPLWAGAVLGYEWLMNFAQIFGVPIRWTNYDSNNADLKPLLAEMMENMGALGWGAFPMGVDLKMHESSRNAGDLPQAALIDMANTACDILFKGQTLTTDAGDRGTQALGTVHFDVLQSRLAAFAKVVSDTASYQLFPAICRLNWGDERDCPVLESVWQQRKDPKAMAETGEILFSKMAIPVSVEHLRTAYEIPEPQPGETLYVPPAQGGQSGAGVSPASPLNGPAPAAPAAKEAQLSAALLSALAAAGLQVSEAGVRVLEQKTGLPLERKPEDTTSAPANASAAPIDAAAPETPIDAATSLDSLLPANLSGIWLARARTRLLEMVGWAKDESLSDAEFLARVTRQQSRWPELLGELNTEALRSALETAMIDAAARGSVKRASTVRS